jgi:hypothetical protein
VAARGRQCRPRACALSGNFAPCQRSGRVGVDCNCVVISIRCVLKPTYNCPLTLMGFSRHCQTFQTRKGPARTGPLRSAEGPLLQLVDDQLTATREGDGATEGAPVCRDLHTAENAGSSWGKRDWR